MATVAPKSSEVRTLKFALSERPRWWYEGRRAATIFINNLSIFFPEGEAFFVRSVRRYAHLVRDPRLVEEVRTFCAQEGMHTREHVRYNDLLARQGYRIADLERRVERLLAVVETVVPPRWKLAATACLEHFTATMALLALAHPSLRRTADPVLGNLWRWHAAEELEHRSVAFDVYELAGGHWLERSGVMLATTAIFWAKVLEQQVALMRDDGLALDGREWIDLARALLVDPGVVRHVARGWLAWFVPGFHPREIPCGDRLEAWRREVATTDYAPAEPRTTDLDVAIVGAGFSGLGMAIRLQQERLGSFAVLEKGDEVGGTWRENRYPGCACDIPSHLYSFSFEPNSRWSERYASQPEILEYLKACTEKHRLRSKIRFGSEVLEARFDEARAVWNIRTSRERLTARHLVLGTGALHRPAMPAIPGKERFRGPSFHSAEWDPRVDLSGKRVAVVGTGASAIQIVPRIAPIVARLDLYQRTPPWVLPLANRPMRAWEKLAFEKLPFARRLYRAFTYASHELRGKGFTSWPAFMKALAVLGRWNIRASIADPALRERVTPAYLPGCKRILISNDYYPTLERKNVELVTDSIREITERGIVTSDGRVREVDAIVFATGFQVTEPPPRGLIVGRGRDLADAWSERIEAYLGTTVAGFPNMFHLMGPNTGLGHNSMVFMIESQIEHVLGLMRTVARRQARTVEVRAEKQRAFNESLAARLAKTVWSSGCESWYRDARGHNPTIWPGSTLEFWWRTLGCSDEDYVFSS